MIDDILEVSTTYQAKSVMTTLEIEALGNDIDARDLPPLGPDLQSVHSLCVKNCRIATHHAL
jgi:hypothetical protein